jgi:hypothetical protein
LFTTPHAIPAGKRDSPRPPSYIYGVRLQGAPSIKIKVMKYFVLTLLIAAPVVMCVLFLLGGIELIKEDKKNKGKQNG